MQIGWLNYFRLEVMKRVLLTGVSGFIGAHCLKYFLENTDWEIVGLDSFRHKGQYSRLAEIEPNNRYKIYQHDLNVPIDDQLKHKILNSKIENGKIVSSKIDYIINVASDSAVERSITNPGQCWKNNCELIFNILEFAREIKPDKFLHVSTDEVYGDCPIDYSHVEWDMIVPSNPYSASKAAQEALAISYFRTYGVPVVICNTMNNIGIWQDKEKFLPKLIRKISLGEQMEIYADFVAGGVPKIGSRFYLHAENHADAFVFLSTVPVTLHDKDHQLPDRYNVVGETELNNLEMAELVAKIMNKPLNYKLFPADAARKGYDRRYALNGNKLKTLGWKPALEFETGLKNIIDWTMKNQVWIM